MLAEFLRRHPEIRVVLETENRVVDLAREDVDVAIRVGRMAASSLMARKLASVELWPCASPGYLAELSTPASPDDIARHTLLGWQDRPDEWTFTGPDGTGHRVAVPAGTTVPEPAVLRLLLAGGAGIGRLPDFLAGPLIGRGELVRVLTDYLPER